MTLAERLRSLRIEFGLSQEALGAQGFVSTPGWVKLEQGNRHPSEKLLTTLVAWMVTARRLPSKNAKPLLDELLTLKYLGNGRGHLSTMARTHARATAPGRQLLAAFDESIGRGRTPARRGRPSKGGAR